MFVSENVSLHLVAECYHLPRQIWQKLKTLSHSLIQTEFIILLNLCSMILYFVDQDTLQNERTYQKSLVLVLKKNIAFAKRGAHLPIAHALHPGMTIWAKSYFFVT